MLCNVVTVRHCMCSSGVQVHAQGGAIVTVVSCCMCSKGAMVQSNRAKDSGPIGLVIGPIGPYGKSAPNGGAVFLHR